jgi:hypothetical protein
VLRLNKVSGDIYEKVVMACLSMDARDTDIGGRNQRELCVKIAADLAEYRV